MTLTVATRKVPVGDTKYYSTGFRQIIEDHLEIIILVARGSEVDLTPFVPHRFVGDLYGLFIAMDIPQQLWWITMRINGYTSPLDFMGDEPSLLRSPREFIEQLLNRYLNSVT